VYGYGSNRMLLGARPMWHSIPGFSEYEISENGEVRRSIHVSHAGKPGRRNKPGQLLKLTPSSVGYLIVTIKNDDSHIRWMGVHVLVALTFHGPRPSPAHKALHWDDDKLNNHFKNIRWGTSRDNSIDCSRNGNKRSGTKMPNAKLTVRQVKKLRALYARGIGGRRLGRIFGMTFVNALRAAQRKTYKDVL